MMPNHGGDPLGPSWDQWGPIGAKKWVKTIKNYHAQKFVFWLLRGHRFGQKIEFTVMAPNHSRKPLESILGPRGPIGAKKMVKTVKNYHAPKFEFLTTPWSSLWAKIELTVMAPNHGGDPLGSILGQLGPIGAKKWVKTVQNYHAPKFEFLTTVRSSICAKNRIYGYCAKSRWGTPGVYLGANGVPLGPKNGSKPSKIAMPQNSNFWLLRPRSSIWEKKRIYVYGTKSRWGPPRVHLGVNGDQLGPKNQKMGENRKKLPCPKFEFLTTPRSSIWAKHRIYGYDAKSRWGTHEVHPRANGSHWGPKMGQNREKLPCPKIRIFDYSAVIDLGKKSNLWLWH